MGNNPWQQNADKLTRRISKKNFSVFLDALEQFFRDASILFSFMVQSKKALAGETDLTAKPPSLASCLPIANLTAANAQHKLFHCLSLPFKILV